MSFYFTVKRALTQEQGKQAQLDADQTFPLSCTCSCFNIFSWKRNMKLKTKECCWAVFLSTTHALVLGSFVVLPRWQRQKDVWRKDFRNSVSVPCFFSYDASVFIRYKELMLVSALVYHPRPHQSFVATLDFFWCQFFSFFIASTSI